MYHYLQFSWFMSEMKTPNKFKNHCISFIVSCPETSAGRRAFVSSCYSPFLTPSGCPADLLLVALAIFLAPSSSWYSQPRSPLPCFPTSALPLPSSLRLSALLTLPSPCSADPSLLPKGPPCSHARRFQRPPPFLSRSLLREDLPLPSCRTCPLPTGWERQPLSPSGSDSRTAGPLQGLPSPAPPGTDTNAQLTQLVT